MTTRSTLAALLLLLTVSAAASACNTFRDPGSFDDESEDTLITGGDATTSDVEPDISAPDVTTVPGDVTTEPPDLTGPGDVTVPTDGGEPDATSPPDLDATEPPDADLADAPDSTCTAPEARCDGSCVNLLTDPLNCGSCEIDCAEGPNVVDGSCDAGTCMQVCAEGSLDCDGEISTGCETDATSLDSCGACGQVCSPMQVCGPSGCEWGEFALYRIVLQPGGTAPIGTVRGFVDVASDGSFSEVLEGNGPGNDVTVAGSLVDNSGTFEATFSEPFSVGEKGRFSAESGIAVTVPDTITTSDPATMTIWVRRSGEVTLADLEGDWNVLGFDAAQFDGSNPIGWRGTLSVASGVVDGQLGSFDKGNTPLSSFAGDPLAVDTSRSIVTGIIGASGVFNNVKDGVLSLDENVFVSSFHDTSGSNGVPQPGIMIWVRNPAMAPDISGVWSGVGFGHPAPPSSPYLRRDFVLDLAAGGTISEANAPSEPDGFRLEVGSGTPLFFDQAPTPYAVTVQGAVDWTVRYTSRSIQDRGFVTPSGNVMFTYDATESSNPAPFYPALSVWIR